MRGPVFGRIPVRRGDNDLLHQHAQTDQLAVTRALHHTFVTVGVLTILSSLSFWTLRKTDGENVSRGRVSVDA